MKVSIAFEGFEATLNIDDPWGCLNRSSTSAAHSCPPPPVKGWGMSRMTLWGARKGTLLRPLESARSRQGFWPTGRPTSCAQYLKVDPKCVQ